MPRYRLTIEYNGGGFAGFQRQPDQITVQSCLEDALQKFSGAPVTVHCAGRTDAGVHAAGQVVHFDLPAHRPAWVVRNAVNHLVRPALVAVVDAAVALPDFDARRSAIGRSYDFTSFRAANCQARSPVKTLDRLDVTRHGAEIWIEADARSFLHNQIRIIAGTLKLVGEGKWSADDVSRTRDAGGAAIRLAATSRRTAPGPAEDARQ